jgi:hypothetical protein
MKRLLPILIAIITIVLIAISLLTSGFMARREMRAANTPDQALRLMLSQIQARNFDAAYARLANRSDVDRNAFARQFSGSYGSLLSYSSLESYDVWGLRTGDQEATFRAKLHYSTAVGQLDDVRDFKLQKSGDSWKVFWPVNNATQLPPQVIATNYLRWDVIGRGAGDAWGVSNVDTPQVRILSMNPIERPDGLVLVGEVVNEDSVPAFVNVGATLLDSQGNDLAQESSFDKIAHTLLPKQVSPYRIDFPGIRKDQIKSVRMDAKALLVAASADPVIEVNQQKLETDPLGKKVLSGQLTDESGEIVDIPHVIAAYYDSNGKVIWVSDGYVAQPLLPQVPVPFAVDVPADIAKNVQTYRVVVNHYDRQT